MSWFDRARPVLALVAVVGLSGCFQPLYGEMAHPGLVEAMREVEVAPIPLRIGHYLGDDLITRMNGSGSTPSAQYRLIVKVSTSSQTPTVESQIETADAATVVGTADFDLIKIEGEKLIYHGTATGAAVYDRSLQSFANLRAARDAEIRLARTLSDEIELRVAAALGQTML
jgi:LPS-assembly lipoprotein